MNLYIQYTNIIIIILNQAVEARAALVNKIWPCQLVTLYHLVILLSLIKLVREGTNAVICLFLSEIRGKNQDVYITP